jgi:hypothetical protein
MLKLLLSTLRLTAGAKAAKAAAARAAAMAVLLLTALMLIAIAIAFGLFAAYGQLATMMTAPAAAGLIAGALAILAIILIVAALWHPKRGAERGEGARAGASFSTVIDDLNGWARGNPTEAALSAFILGMALSRRKRGSGS